MFGVFAFALVIVGMFTGLTYVSFIGGAVLAVLVTFLVFRVFRGGKGGGENKGGRGEHRSEKRTREKSRKSAETIPTTSIDAVYFPSKHEAVEHGVEIVGVGHGKSVRADMV